MMRFITVDPGLGGAVSCIDQDMQLVLCRDLPTIAIGKLQWIDANDLTSILMECRNGTPAQITVERAQPMPKQGTSSTFTTGCVMGSILAACQRLAVPLHVVSAAQWKRVMGLGADKAESISRAKLLFPDAPLTLKRHHDRAESLLLAEYARRVFTGQVAT
jgi:hypothetical protein